MPWLSASAVRIAPSRSTGARGRFALALVLLLVPALGADAQVIPIHDRIDLTGQQNLTLGAGARAYGMGGAFIARADDATAASWNPAGLTQLESPEFSAVYRFSAREDSHQSSSRDLLTDRDHYSNHELNYASAIYPFL